MLEKPKDNLSDRFNAVCGDVRTKAAKCAAFSSLGVAFAVSSGIAGDPLLMIPSLMLAWPISGNFLGVIDDLEELRGMYKDSLSQENEESPSQEKSDPPDFKPR